MALCDWPKVCSIETTGRRPIIRENGSLIINVLISTVDQIRRSGRERESSQGVFAGVGVLRRGRDVGVVGEASPVVGEGARWVQ